MLGWLLFLILIVFATTQNFKFSSNMTCIEMNSQRCLRWSESTKVYYHQNYFHFCLPAGTLLITPNGQKTIENLYVGQTVLGWNKRQQRQQWTSIGTWINRQAEVQSHFFKVTTQLGTFLASFLHNVAIRGKEGEIFYIFAKDLQVGMQLVSLTKNVSVTAVESEVLGVGLYSPLTWTSNFFVLPFGSAIPILLHSFSHIKSPSQYEQVVTPLLFLISYFFPPSNYDYVNPFFLSLRYFLGEDWVEYSQTVSLEIASFSQQSPEDGSRLSLSRRRSRKDQDDLIDVIDQVTTSTLREYKNAKRRAAIVLLNMFTKDAIFYV